MQKCVLYVCINFHAIAPQLHTHTPLCFHRASYVCTFMCLDVTWGQLILHKVNSKHTTTTTNNNFCSNGLARRNIEEHLRKSEIDGRSVVPLENSHSLLYKFFSLRFFYREESCWHHGSRTDLPLTTNIIKHNKWYNEW